MDVVCHFSSFQSKAAHVRTIYAVIQSVKNTLAVCISFFLSFLDSRLYCLDRWLECFRAHPTCVFIWEWGICVVCSYFRFVVCCAQWELLWSFASVLLPTGACSGKCLTLFPSPTTTYKGIQTTHCCYSLKIQHSVCFFVVFISSFKCICKTVQSIVDTFLVRHYLLYIFVMSCKWWKVWLLA